VSDARRGPPRWLWPVSVVLQVASAAALTSYTYFFVDDFLFLRQAHTLAFGQTYLRLPLFEHFSPITRLLNKVLVTIAPGSFTFAHAVQLAMYALAVVAFALLVVAILGNTWLAFALTLAFGQSLFLMRLLNWWTASANILPSTIFTALALLGYLLWRRSRSPGWLVLSLAAFVGAVLDYESGELIPVYIGIVALLVLADDLHPRALLQTLWRERWAWIGYGVIEAGALANYFHRYYFASPRPSTGKFFHFLEISLFQAFIPALVGIVDPQSALGRSAVVTVVVALLAIAAVAVILYVRPRAWRCLAAFAAVFLVTMAPLGLNRIGLFGVGVGYELYYQQSLQLMFLVLVAFALSPLTPRVRDAPRALRLIAVRLKPLPYAIPAVAAAAIAAYGVLYVSSVHDLANSSWQPRRAHSYISTFEASVRAARTRTGHEPVLIDHSVPPDLMPAIFVPFNHYDQFFPVIDSHLHYDRASGPTYLVDINGRLVPVRFQSTSLAKPEAACVPSTGNTSRLQFSLAPARPRVPPSGGLPYALRVTVRMPRGAAVNVLLSDRRRLTLDTGYPQIWSAGTGTYYVPLSLSSRIDGAALDLPGGTCITRLALGTFAVSGPPV
jgi:hypothetical protein